MFKYQIRDLLMKMNMPKILVRLKDLMIIKPTTVLLITNKYTLHMKKLMIIALFAVGLASSAQIKKFELSEYGINHGLTCYFTIKLPNKSKEQIKKIALAWTLSKPLKGMDIGALNSVNQSRIGLLQFHINTSAILTFGGKPQNQQLQYSINIHTGDQSLSVSYNYIKNLNKGTFLEENYVRDMFENDAIKSELANDKKVYESVINEVGLSLAKKFKII